MTRACRDCKWARLPRCEDVRNYGSIVGNVNGAWIACANGDGGQFVQPGSVCDKWEPWAEMEVDFDLREEFRALADRINEGGNHETT